MDFEQEQAIIVEIKKYVTENLPLSKMSDEELEEKVEEKLIQCQTGLGLVGIG